MATKSQKTYLTEFIVLNLFNLARCEENYVSQFETQFEHTYIQIVNYIFDQFF